MAELFSYASSEAMVNPSSPTIQVQANMQAANAFDSIGKMISTAGQFRAQQIQQETQFKAEQLRLAEEIRRRKEDLITTRDKALKERISAQKAEDKLQEDRDFVAVNTQLTDMMGSYQNAKSKAGDDPTLLYEAAVMYRSDLRNTLANSSEGLQARISNSFEGEIRKASEDVFQLVQKSDVASFWDNMHRSMPVILAMDPEVEKEEYKNLQAKASALGIPLTDLGEKYVAAQKSLLMSNIAENENEIIKNYDVTSIDHAIDKVKRLKDIDGRNPDVIKSALDELNALRKKVSDNAVAVAKQFAQDGNLSEFDMQFAIVQEIGELNDGELINLQQDFFNTYYSEKNVNRRAADTFIDQTGGTGPTNALPTAVKNLVENEMRQQIGAMILTGKLNPEYMRQVAYNNPDLYKSSFLDGYQVGIGQLKELANKFVAAGKDEEAQQQIRGNIFNTLRGLNRLRDHAYGAKSDPLLLQAVVAESLLTSSAIANIPEALEKMNDMTEIKMQPKASKEVRNLEEELPDSFDEAYREYSALVELTKNKELAYKTVYQKYTMTSVDGNDAEMSGAVLSFLYDSGISEDELEKWEEYLPAYLESKGNRGKSLENFNNVMKGSNPRVVMDGNDMKYMNDEGSVVRLPFSRSEMKDVIKFVNKRFEEENVPDAWDKIWGEVTDRAAEIFYANGDTAYKALKVPALAVANAGVSVISIGDTFKTMGTSFGTHFTTWVDNVRYKGMDPYEAKNQMLKSIEADWKKQVKKNKGIDTAANEAFVQAMAEAGASIDVQLDAVGNALNQSGQVGKDIAEILGGAMEATFNAIIPKAEGSELTDSNMDYWAQAEGTTTHFDAPTNGILTMPYGVVPDGGITFTKDGKTQNINARNSGLTASDLPNIDTSKATKKIYSASGSLVTTIKRADYTTDEEFAGAVFDAYETEAKKNVAGYDNLTDGQKKFMVDMVWNAGQRASLWNDPKNAINELKKDNPNYNIVYKVMRNLNSGGVANRGVLKRRAMSLNLMITDDSKKIEKIKTYKLPNGKTRFSAITKSGLEILARDEANSSAKLGTLPVPQ